MATMGMKQKPVTGMGTGTTGRSTTKGPKTGPVKAAGHPSKRNGIPHGSYKLKKNA